MHLQCCFPCEISTDVVPKTAKETLQEKGVLLRTFTSCHPDLRPYKDAYFGLLRDLQKCSHLTGTQPYTIELRGKCLILFQEAVCSLRLNAGYNFTKSGGADAFDIGRLSRLLFPLSSHFKCDALSGPTAPDLEGRLNHPRLGLHQQPAATSAGSLPSKGLVLQTHRPQALDRSTDRYLDLMREYICKFALFLYHLLTRLFVAPRCKSPGMERHPRPTAYRDSLHEDNSTSAPTNGALRSHEKPYQVPSVESYPANPPLRGPSGDSDGSDDSDSGSDTEPVFIPSRSPHRQSFGIYCTGRGRGSSSCGSRSRYGSGGSSAGVRPSLRSESVRT